LLNSMGAEAHAGYDGRSAVAIAEEISPRIVLLDIGLPDIDGYTVCRQLRERFGGSMRIVALTGWGQERDKQEAARAGFDGHLTKPADPAALEGLITKLLAETSGSR
jgi:DNA-binding response OmpR family regulator